MDYLSIFVVRFILLFLGLAGNSVGLAVFFRKNMAKLGTKKFYRTMLFLDSLFLCTQITEDSALSLGLDLKTVSTLSCKIRYYWNFSIGPVSPWLLVYITVERYIAIQHNTITIFKQKHFQNFIIIFIFIYNLGIYSPMAILTQVFSEPINTTAMSFNQTDLYIYCDFAKPIQLKIMSTLDLINSALAPFFIMLAFSIALICVIFQKRLRILNMRSKRDKNRLIRDIRFALSSIMLNITFVTLNLPLCLNNIFFPNASDFWYNVFLIIFYATFSINSYILAFFNSIFRNELLSMFKLKEKPKELSKTIRTRITTSGLSQSGST